eukprot:g267.t1
MSAFRLLKTVCNVYSSYDLPHIKNNQEYEYWCEVCELPFPTYVECIVHEACHEDACSRPAEEEEKVELVYSAEPRISRINMAARMIQRVARDWLYGRKTIETDFVFI